MRVFHGDPTKLAASRPALSPELLAVVAERYGLGVDTPRDLGGSFNLNVMVDRYVLRVYGPWVSAERVQELQRIRQTLERRGVPIPDLLPALDGSLWSEFDGCALEVEQYVVGERMKCGTELRIGMEMLGHLHTLMADLTVAVPPPIANHLPQELAFDVTLDATAFIRSWGPTPREDRLAKSAEALARLLPVVELPSQLVHGDFWDNNVLFNGTDVVAVLDFDFAGIRPRIDDLALPLCYAAQNGVGFGDLKELVDAYDTGCTNPLSSTERRALPFAMARMALFFLQYLLLPPTDEDYAQRLRREFNEERGPSCTWWLDRIREGTVSDKLFA